MADECRDWLATLWQASYKGVPFYFESDDEEGGRDNVKHVFPNSDQPYIEDLGESLRYFGGVAYVFGDGADSLAASLIAALTSYGPGMLVTPLFGPVMVNAEPYKRSHQRDKLGYVAFELKFVRAGALTALISIPFAQTQAFAAVANLATALANLFPPAITTQGRPDYVVAGAADTLASGVAMLDVQRQSYAVDPDVSAATRDTIATLVDAIPLAVNAEAPAGVVATVTAQAALVQQIVAVTRAVADGMAPASAQRAMIEIVEAFRYTPPAVPFVSQSAQLVADNTVAAMAVVRLAAMSAYADAVLRMTFAARPDGVTARGEVAERFETEMNDTTGAENAALYRALDDLRSTVIAYLSAVINDLAPLIEVDTVTSRPALDLAWLLYADPSRADELVARNYVRDPFFMPLHLTALES